ncbi:thioesterase II family protein [Kitasatospora viridis]|uniref:Surfactin synthase thioesterase subunit n=1 Tax=Kitasatospora viridis TaxID=281105 RepID=A0A561SDG7_9ACTN|nr:thioesterase domain-containing protein [Kitasatospora viridis]TWF72890.1 surfactin synthase thioesterase subunit [Kitasatospora viridis]
MTTAARVRPRVEGDWLFVPVPQPHSPYRLFCFPHAGGDATAYTRLARALAPVAEVWALRLPARGGRLGHPMPGSFDLLVEAVVHALDPHLTGRFGFYGQSFGALLGYEVAQALPAGRRPELLVAAAASPPADWIGPERPQQQDADDLLRLAGLGELIELEPELKEHALHSIRADLAVSTGYRHRPHPPLDAALHAVIGAEDPMVGTARLDGWAEHTRAAFGRHTVPGGHLLATVDLPGPVELLTSLITRPAAAHQLTMEQT